MYTVYCYGPNDDFDKGQNSKKLGPFESLEEAHLAGDLWTQENINDKFKQDDFVSDIERL